MTLGQFQSFPTVMGDNRFKAFPVEVQRYQIGGFLIVFNNQNGLFFGTHIHGLRLSHAFLINRNKINHI